MLTFFPAPYPNEWWYSVICRYYVSTGVPESFLVKKQLFGGAGGAYMGTLFPNGTIHRVLEQLPPGLFNIKDILLQNTPFLYYVRMYPEAERMSMLDALCRGDTVQLTHLWKSFSRAAWRPRYCPMCAAEDRVNYAEPYWHVDHQIPLMSICTKHKCRLHQLELESLYPTLNQRFFPLAAVTLKEATADYPEWEEVVSRIVYEYWKLPISVGPTKHNNLVQLLHDKGYTVIHRQGRVTLDRKRLYKDLVTFYGAARVEESFGAAIDPGMVRRIIEWQQLLPDRYILLQAVVGASTDLVFHEEPLPDQQKEQLQALAASGRFCTMKQVAGALKLKPYELNTLARHYNIAPFWRPESKGKSVVPKTAAIRMTLEQEELARIEEMSKQMGYRNIGAFALDCVRYVMDDRAYKNFDA